MLTNQQQVALPLAVFLAVDDYLYAKTPNEISATTLMRSPRYIMGSKRQMYPEQFPQHLVDEVILPQGQLDCLETLASPIYPDIQEKIASRVGTAIHSGVEQAWLNKYKEGLTILGYPEAMIDKIRINPTTPKSEDDIDVYMEQRLYKDITVDGKDFTISGQFDFVLDGNLHDIKTTSTFVYETGCNDAKYILQGSIYRWLNPELITGDTITINFVFTDWKNFQKSKETYPPAKAMSKSFQLMSLEETEMYVKNKLKILVQHWDSPLHLIPCCTDKEKYSKPSVFKYYKAGFEPGKRATKNFSSMQEAQQYKAITGKAQGDIVEDKGKPFLCPFCEITPMTANNSLEVVSKSSNFIIE